MCASDAVRYYDSNAIFISVRRLEMKSQFEKITSSTDTVFGLHVYFWPYMFAKNRCINMKYGMQDVQALFYNMLHGLSGKFENSGFVKS